jgi:hypothetical protein
MARRLPRTLLNGRLRTSTVLIVALFVALLLLYLQVRPASGTGAPNPSAPEGPVSTAPASPSSTTAPPAAPPSTPGRSTPAPAPTPPSGTPTPEPSEPIGSATEPPDASAPPVP